MTESFNAMLLYYLKAIGAALQGTSTRQQYWTQLRSTDGCPVRWRGSLNIFYYGISDPVESRSRLIFATAARFDEDILWHAFVTSTMRMGILRFKPSKEG